MKLLQKALGTLCTSCCCAAALAGEKRSVRNAAMNKIPEWTGTGERPIVAEILGWEDIKEDGTLTNYVNFYKPEMSALITDAFLRVGKGKPRAVAKHVFDRLKMLEGSDDVRLKKYVV